MKKEMPTTKVCKHCKTEIPYGAKICPQCRKKQGGGGCLLVILIVVGIGIAASFSGGNKKTTASTGVVSQTDSGKATQAETTVAEKTTFGIGEVAEVKGIQVSLVGISESKGSTYVKPDDGNIYVLCEFEIANNSDSDISVSSMISFEAYCDDYSINQDIMGLQAPEGNGKTQLDGSVAAGKKMNGIIAYQVPAEWASLEVKFSPSFWSNKSATFVVDK